MDERTFRAEQKRNENIRDWIATGLLLFGFGLLYIALHVELR